MKRIDRLILGELLGPWAFGVSLFTVLLVASGPLNKITSLLVGGAPGSAILQLLGLMVPALLVKTFSMAMLLAGLLGFGRLSSDSEIIALKASGASVPRIVWPVIVAALVVSIVTFVFNDRVVPKAARTALSLITRLAHEGKVGGRAFSHEIVEKGKVVGIISARNADLATQTLQDVSVLSYNDKGPQWLLLAPNVHFNVASKQDWRIDGAFKIVPVNDDPRAVINQRGGAWPTGYVPKPSGTLEDMLIKKDDYDAYTIAELKARIAEMKRVGDVKERDIRDYEYGFYNKYSVAFAALVFGTLGAALGITNRRTGTASGFALAVGIIFGYVFLANFMNEWARGGVLPPWAASFAPLCIGAVACGVIIYRRNA